MKDTRPIYIRIAWFIVALIGTPFFAIWNGYDDSKHYFYLAFRDFKYGLVSWFSFIKTTYMQIKEDL